MKKLALLLLLFAAALSAPPLHAQTVRGSFVDPTTGEPIPGARAVLRGADGRDAAAAMTRGDGSFVLQAAAAGTYSLRVERIGFAATETPAFSLGAGETVQRRVEANAQRIVLAGIVAQARSRCTPRPGSGPQTATVWGEARKVLGSARETAEGEGYRYAVRRYWRTLNPRGDIIVNDTVATGEVSSGTPFVAVPLDRLSRFGYVEQDVAGFAFHAPDARVLLSDEFQERHCFALVEGDSGLIGLSFEPVSNARPDVQGTLWLDRGTAELRRLEYRYTRIPGMRREGVDAAGGRMEFARLPDGRWIVGRWSIRMPIVTATRVQGAARIPDAISPEENSLSYRLAAIREEGGEILTASAAAGDVQVAVAGSGTLRGTVWDSTTSRPLAGATVSAAGHRAMTDSLGRFTISGLSAGEYQLSFASPRLDSLRFTPAPVGASVREGETTERALSIPPLAVVWAARCEAGPASTGALVGTVRGAAGGPAAGARVTVSWAGAQQPASAVADSQGVYRICGAPAGVPLVVRATTAEADVTLSGILVSTDRPRREDLSLPAPRTASATVRTATGTAAGVSGVLRDAAGRPVAGASVRVGTLAAVTTDAQGRFRVRGAAAGTHLVAVTHPSLGSRSVEVPLTADAAELELRAGEGTRLAASVQRVVQLAGIGASAQARRPGLDIQGFYERQKVGIGVFLTGERLNRGPAGKLSDVLRQVSGVGVMLFNDQVSSASMNSMAPIMVAVSSRGSGGIDRRPPCFMDVYMDGMRMETPQNLDRVNLAAVEAVEVYRGAEVPPEYRNSVSGCGVVLIWTKR